MATKPSCTADTRGISPSCHDGILTSPAMIQNPPGQTSTVAQLNSISDSEDTDLYGPAPPINRSQKINGRSRRKMMACEAAKTAFVYPRPRDADDYLKCYWEFVHPIFPVLHKPGFMAKYNDVCLTKNSKEPVNVSLDALLFYSILNLVFALGCQHSSLLSQVKKPATAEQFYQRSRSVTVSDMLDSISLLSVQFLVLQSICLQSSQYATRCWNTLGIAIRAAQGLGLHLNVLRRSETQLDREIKRRVWHTCVTLDR